MCVALAAWHGVQGLRPVATVTRGRGRGAYPKFAGAAGAVGGDAAEGWCATHPWRACGTRLRLQRRGARHCARRRQQRWRRDVEERYPAGRQRAAHGPRLGLDLLGLRDRGASRRPRGLDHTDHLQSNGRIVQCTARHRQGHLEPQVSERQTSSCILQSV